MSSTHYCVWDLCNSQQYCCGDNVCCNETDFNSLLLTVISFGILLIMALCSIYFYYHSRRIYASFLKKYFKISYTLMSNKQENKTTTATNQEIVTEGCVV